MENQREFMQYPVASIQQELALDAMLDKEVTTRIKRRSDRQDLRTRLKKQPLTWQQRQQNHLLPRDWFLAKSQG